jgi:hypothetical protein
MTNTWLGLGPAVQDIGSRYGASLGELLEGETVTALYMMPDGSSLHFETARGGYIGFQVDGDCCSQSYFHEIDGIDSLLGATVATFSEMNLPENLINHFDSNYSGGESNQFYGIRIITNKGYCAIVFRNESNGYYGGSCSRGINTTPTVANLIPITKDGDLYKENMRP